MGSINKIGKALKPFVKKVKTAKGDLPNALYQTVIPYKLNTPTTVGAISLVTAGSLGNETFKAHNKGKMGYKSVGEGLSGMTATANEHRSELIDKVHNRKYNPNNIDTKLSTHGAEGDLVFALHNMR